MSRDGLFADGLQLGFGKIAAGDGIPRDLLDASLYAGFAEGAEEGIGRVSDQRIEDEIRFGFEDRLDDPVDICFADGKIPFRDHRAAPLEDLLAQHPVALPCPDVVRADAESISADMADEVIHQRQHMVVR